MHLPETHPPLSSLEAERYVHARYVESQLRHVDERLEEAAPVLNHLLQQRLTIFQGNNLAQNRPSDFVYRESLETQLYADLTYNVDFYVNELGLRGRGAIEYHREVEKYDAAASDSEEVSQQKRHYRQAIRIAAQQLGFVAPERVFAEDPLDERFGIGLHRTIPFSTPFEAAIVPGGAGLTNHLRLHHAVQNIERGVSDPEKLFIASCSRRVNPAELSKLAGAEMHGGESEFELCQSALLDVAGGFVEPARVFTYPVELDSGIYKAQALEGDIIIGDRLLPTTIVSAPFDPKRTLPDGQLATRANADETFIALRQFLSPHPTALLIESHDTWIPAQAVTAERLLGFAAMKYIHQTGPFRQDRIYETGDGRQDIYMAEAVVDEMTKYYNELVRLRAAYQEAQIRLAVQSQE